MFLDQVAEDVYCMDMANERILVVDDDREIVRMVRGYLEQSGYEVLSAYDGESALHMMRQEHPDLLLLDLMMPERDGWDVTRVVRSDETLEDTPIIMLTARVEDTDKIVGLELGADDYITKPFNPREVLARVRAILRRQQRGTETRKPSVYRTGDLEVDAGRRIVTVHGEEVELTRTEYSLLLTLMQNPGYVFTRSELIEKALGYSYEGMDRSLDTHIKNLRNKIGDAPKQPTYIQTVYGVGYRMADPS